MNSFNPEPLVDELIDAIKLGHGSGLASGSRQAAELIAERLDALSAREMQLLAVYTLGIIAGFEDATHSGGNRR